MLPALLSRLEAAERAREARREGRPQTLTTVTEELDGEGQVTARTEVVSRRTSRGGALHEEVVRASRADMRYAFDVPTPTGNDLGRFVIDGEGGVLFLRKRVRITGTVRSGEGT